jgi:uncharacterized BrkB/YihY/UPF0761 family membrane protein
MDAASRRLFWTLSSLALLLVALHFFPASLSLTVANRFNLDREANIPTWYSTVLLFSVSLASFGIHRFAPRDAHLPRSSRRFWAVFASAFCFFSLDEAAELHEIIGRCTPVKWVYVYVPVCGVFLAVCALYFLVNRRNERVLGTWILGGLATATVGAMGCEGVSHWFRPLPPVLQQVEFAVEEGLEMIGTIMVLTGCVKELRRLSRDGAIDGPQTPAS